MSRSHSKHLAPSKWAKRAPSKLTEDGLRRRALKSHKQKRSNVRTSLRREYL